MHLYAMPVLLAAALLVSPVAPASAQDPIQALESQSFEVYERYRLTLATLIESSGSIKEARGLKDESAARAQLVADLKKPATKPDPKLLAAGLTFQSDDNKAWEAQTDTVAGQLSEEQRQMLAAGLKLYLSGVGQTVALTKVVPELVNVTTRAMTSNPLKLRSAKQSLDAARDMAKGIPSLAKEHATVVGAMKDYVARNKIPLDASAFRFDK